MRLALATCAEMPAGDPDDEPLVAALAERGIEPAWCVWSDPAVAWESFDAVLIRSTWDYQGRLEEFLAWAGELGSVWNPAAVLRWNTDKRYLAELAAAGLPVVATEFFDPGTAVALPTEGEFVVKPSVSAGSRDTARFSAGERDAALALAAAIHASGRTAMVQPYLDAVDANGETALLYFGGEFSHSVRKGPLLEPGAGPTNELFAAETIEPRTASPAERGLGEAAIAAVEARFGPLPYARVDVILSATGDPVVLEVELTEPSLFFTHAGGAATRFAAALAGRALTDVDL